MTGKTHMAVGMSITLLFTRPEDVTSLMLCLGVSIIGSVISDIDVNTSISYRKLNQVTKIALFSFIILSIADAWLQFGIIELVKQNSSIMRLLIGFLIFLIICAFGKRLPHRSFMHSLPAVSILTAVVFIMLPKASVYFAVSMLSHIILDILNYKNVRLFYPSKWGISLDLCRANGTANTVLFWIGNTALVIEVIYFTGKIGLQLLENNIA